MPYLTFTMKSMSAFTSRLDVQTIHRGGPEKGLLVHFDDLIHVSLDYAICVSSIKGTHYSFRSQKRTNESIYCDTMITYSI